MNDAAAIEKMIQICKDEIKESNFIPFLRIKLQFAETRILEPWEKKANLTRPEKISDDYKGVTINSEGIVGSGHDFKWNEIIATGIKTEDIPENDDSIFYRRHLLIALKNGKIIQIEIGNIDNYHGLFGHFIEEYKLAYLKK
jgi:hypothetical protein